MAQWRPLHRRITSSDKVVTLAHDPFALWLYCALLPHTDQAGRLNANPTGLAGTIFEGYGYTPESIEAGLRALADAGLIELYANGRNRHLLQYTKFQEMCNPDKREAKTELPGPDDEGSEHVPDKTPEVPAATPAPLPEVSANTPRTTRPLHGDGDGDVHGDEDGELSATSELANLDPPPVEAAPRRELEPPATKREIHRTKTPVPAANRIRDIDQPFMDAWNEHSAPLPRITALDKDRRRHLDGLRKEFGEEALDVFRDAVKQVAREGFYREKHYGFNQLLAAGNLLMWAEKWRDSNGMTDADRRLADKAARVADAIGGLP